MDASRNTNANPDTNPDIDTDTNTDTNTDTDTDVFHTRGDGCLKKATERNPGLIFMFFKVSFAQSIHVKADICMY